MRILLDAHALIWWLDGDPRLSTSAGVAIETSENVLVGAGSVVEIAIKQSLGKLDTNASWFDEVQANGIDLLAITWSHASRLQSLPYVRIAGREHRDPFDRLLAAQALADKVPVVTRDPALSAYGVGTIW
jgi:PIN domain nuclease of toxin-antitoxin system